MIQILLNAHLMSLIDDSKLYMSDRIPLPTGEG